MTEIKKLKNYAFRWLLVALLSVMFIVLLGGYWWHIHTTDSKLKDWTEPLQDITSSLLSSASGSSDDGLIRSTIMQREALISGLDLTPSISNDLRHYITNLYTVAGAFDTAKAALPQTNDRDYLFTIGTINLLQTNSLLSGDVLGLYSGRQTIQDAISYLSGSLDSTLSKDKKAMSHHNLSVALASQIGVEVLLCTKSYDALATSWSTIGSYYSGVLASYRNQIDLLNTLSGSSSQQCLAQYAQQLTKNIQDINNAYPTVEKMITISASRQRTYADQPLQCPIGIDLYDEIISLRRYESEVADIARNVTIMEGALLSGDIPTITQTCNDISSSTGSNLQSAIEQLTGEKQTFSGSVRTTNTGSYTTLPEDTQSIINDIYQKNVQYINTMQQSDMDVKYNPLQRIQQLFKEFYGDTKEFIK